MATLQPDLLPSSNFRRGEWDIASHAFGHRMKLDGVHEGWFKQQPFRFDVAVALHVPKAFRTTWGADEYALQLKLSRFLTRLDRKVLKAACRHRKQKIPRYVVLEHSPAVGWHVHALFSSETSRFSTEQLCTVIELMWLAEFSATTLKGFEPYLGYAKPVTGGYANYMGKKLYGPHATGIFDDRNSVF